MPIGKSSIARVANNGYSNVKTEAPDMENSHIENPVEMTEKVAAKKQASVKSGRTGASKSSSATGSKTNVKVVAKKTSKIKNTETKTSEVKAEKTETAENAITADVKNTGITDKGTVNTAQYVNVGMNMPYYLL